MMNPYLNLLSFEKTINGDTMIVFKGAPFDQLTEDIVEELVDNLKLLLNKEKNFIADFSGEGLPANPILITNAILKRLNEKFPNSYKNFILRSGGASTNKNLDLYKELCEKYNFINDVTIFNNGFEKYIHGPSEEIFNTSPRIKPKKFLSLNNTQRSHRCYIISQLIKHNLLDSCYVSFLFRKNHENDQLLNKLHIHSTNILQHQLPNLWKDTVQILESNLHLFPLELNWKTQLDYNNYCFDIKNDVDYYNNSYFSLVTESKYFKDVPTFLDSQFNCYFFSEKTWKPILAKHPFILVGREHSLKVLKELGYKTFHPYINESYDDIVDDELRLQEIMKEVLRLSSFTDNEWIEWQTSIRDTVEFNFKHRYERSK